MLEHEILVADIAEIVAKNYTLVDTKDGIYQFRKKLIEVCNEYIVDYEFRDKKLLDFCMLIVTKNSIREVDIWWCVTKRKFYAVWVLEEVAKYILHTKSHNIDTIKHIYKYINSKNETVWKVFDKAMI